jgi:hypothetical protein
MGLSASKAFQSGATPDYGHVGTVWEVVGEGKRNSAMEMSLRGVVMGLEIRCRSQLPEYRRQSWLRHPRVIHCGTASITKRTQNST